MLGRKSGKPGSETGNKKSLTNETASGSKKLPLTSETASGSKNPSMTSTTASSSKNISLTRDLLTGVHFAGSYPRGIANSPRPLNPQRPIFIPDKNQFPKLENQFEPLANTTPSPSTKTITAPKETFKQALTNTSPSTSIKTPVPSPSKAHYAPTECEYQTKPISDEICVLEPEIYEQVSDLNPCQLAQYFLPSTHHYLPENFGKTQSYYENILVLTKSIYVQYVYDNIDHNKIRYCKVKLLQVLTLRDWGMKPHLPRETMYNNQLIKYNYWDYITSWTRAFYRQNNQFSLSYFFYFETNFHYPIPYWFHTWWDKFGINETIFPTIIKEAFIKFTDLVVLPEEYQTSPPEIIYAHTFAIPWIFMTEYSVNEKPLGNFVLPMFQRNFKIKWWNKTDIDKCGPAAVFKFFQDNPQLSKEQLSNITTRNEEFLRKKQLFMTRMATVTDDSEFMTIIEQLSGSSTPSEKMEPAEDTSIQNDDFFTQAEL
jgi:hypothetical protein